MMVLAANTYFQKVTYWEGPTEGGFGEQTFTAPIILDARWEERTETFTDLSGTEKRSKAIIFVQQSLKVRGYLYKGVSAALDPTTVSGAWAIQRFDEIPDFRNLNSCFRAFI